MSEKAFVHLRLAESGHFRGGTLAGQAAESPGDIRGELATRPGQVARVPASSTVAVVQGCGHARVSSETVCVCRLVRTGSSAVRRVNKCQVLSVIRQAGDPEELMVGSG